MTPDRPPAQMETAPAGTGAADAGAADARVTGSRRAMAGLAVVHGVAAAAVLATGTGISVTTVLVYGGFALVIAVPQAFTRPRGFEVACGVVAALVMGGGLLLAFGGGPLFWPAALPLVLAVTPVATTRPPWPVPATAALLAIAWATAVVILLS